jgi:hypothetical protein
MVAVVASQAMNAVDAEMAVAFVNVRRARCSTFEVCGGWLAIGPALRSIQRDALDTRNRQRPSREAELD